ncbi:sulfatase-like hydrolase/transferase [Pelagicoccus mobilis]|uniref:Sulfatase-like hydrolase/transferase n=1 Tax=Pelagicoccus mobilis TaxID=415221 RepID=A0A934S3F2_9BACT|nr:sulfatase-like hydrolase/transferase [Pelagicoccus mobilis]MBK1878328.1 sulfatase-like hydrolase/transferase [Pelagicoccus mobilis]
MKVKVWKHRIISAVLASIVLQMSTAAEERPNILWIVAEDISPMFGCYGDKDAYTPNVDRFAERSFLFQNAFATAPICAPSRSSLAAGMYSTSLGSQHLRTNVEIPGSVQPLMKVFRDNGYWVSNRGKTDYNFNPDGLFDYWDENTTPWRERPEGTPFFSFLNLGATHEGSGNISERARIPLAHLDERVKKDPSSIELPPYYLDTPEMRRIWARYHDLISVWDMEVGKVLSALETDGLLENTIVFLMADHGLGMPRYKRWLYTTGLRVPLIVHIPEAYANFHPGGKDRFVDERMVSYIDLPATALTLAGIEVPDTYHGESLFKKGSADVSQREHVFGTRDRADDMYDLSRCVFDGRYLYIRHYMPHLPWIQEGVIFNPERKESVRELHRIRDAGEDTDLSKLLWEERPREELYDLQEDPQELINIADRDEVRGVKEKLSHVLRNWILETRDSGFLNEAEMQRRAREAGLTPYEMMQDDSLYPIEEILAAAEDASNGMLPSSSFDHQDPAVRFWVLMSAIIAKADDSAARELFVRGSKDQNLIVRATAAEGLGRIGETELAKAVFRELLQETELTLALYVARCLALSLDDASDLEKEIREARERFMAPPGSRRPWNDFEHSAFTAWALEWALIKSGLNEYGDFEGW